MEFEFDQTKERLNMRRHRLSLALAAEMDWENAVVEIDNRFFYDEVRMNALVSLENRLYYVTFTERDERMRVISLRYATNPEKKRYVQKFC
jgi:uncharacterized DUF497 family protein